MDSFKEIEVRRWRLEVGNDFSPSLTAIVDFYVSIERGRAMMLNPSLHLTAGKTVWR